MRRWEWIVWADRGKELRSWREGVGDPLDFEGASF